jgi:hypothetical protein
MAKVMEKSCIDMIKSTSSQARDKLATLSFKASADKRPEPRGIDSLPLFGDKTCAIRPQLVCPVPAVEIDTPDSDTSSLA